MLDAFTCPHQHFTKINDSHYELTHDTTSSLSIFIHVISVHLPGVVTLALPIYKQSLVRHQSDYEYHRQLALSWKGEAQEQWTESLKLRREK